MSNTIEKIIAERYAFGQKGIGQIVNTLCDFIAYVDSFYNAETGIYPIKGMTNQMVINGVQSYITQIGQGESLEWGGGDSVDRERVRDIILADNGLQWG